MTAVAPATNRPMIQAQQSATTPLVLKNLAQKISEFVLSKWTLIAAGALFAGVYFDLLAALVVVVVGSLVAAMSGKKTTISVPAPVPSPILPVPGTPNSRDHNIGIFNQTLAIINEGLRINPDKHREMLERAVVVQPINARCPVPAVRVATQFVVEPVTTYEMTRRLVQLGHCPLVLDMANLYKRGGGVKTGANAQEETLCRQSNLYPALERLPYPLPVTGGALVPGVQFFRDDQYNVVEPIIGDVFVSAAYNSNRRHGDGYDRPQDDEFYSTGTDAKIRTMLRTAIQRGNRTLVLSAFGCGAFRNDPHFIADTYRRIFNEDEFRGAFDIVAFGIFDTPGAQHPNCPIFRNAFINRA